jgi:hypothetical protein
MSTLWNHGDPQNPARHNYGAHLPARLKSIPVGDIRPGLSLTVTPQNAQSIMDSNVSTLWTGVAAGGIGQIDSISFINTDTVKRWAKIWIGTYSVAPVNASRIWSDYVYPNERVVLRAPWLTAPGEGLVTQAEIAGVMKVSAEFLSWPLQPEGSNLMSPAPVFITTLGDHLLYEAPSGILQATLLSVTLANVIETPVTRIADVYRSPTAFSGSSSGVHVIREVLRERGTAIEDTPMILLPGDKVIAKADAINAIACRVAVWEVM